MNIHSPSNNKFVLSLQKFFLRIYKKVFVTLDGKQFYPFRNGVFINVKSWLDLDEYRMSKETVWELHLWVTNKLSDCVGLWWCCNNKYEEVWRRKIIEVMKDEDFLNEFISHTYPHITHNILPSATNFVIFV